MIQVLARDRQCLTGLETWTTAVSWVSCPGLPKSRKESYSLTPFTFTLVYGRLVLKVKAELAKDLESDWRFSSQVFQDSANTRPGL